MKTETLSTPWYIPYGHTSSTVRLFLLKNGWIKEEQFHREDVDDKIALEIIPNLSDQNLLRFFTFVVENNYPRVLRFVLDESKSRQQFPITYDQMDDALKKCSKKGHIEIVRILSQNGADIHIDQDYPMRLAASGGHTLLVEYFLDHGATVHSRDNFALIMSSRYGFDAIVDLLIQRGADGSARNYAAIMESAKNGYLNITRKLFSTFLQLETSESCLFWAIEQENFELVKNLLNLMENDIQLSTLISKGLENYYADPEYKIRHVLYIFYERGINMSVEDNLAIKLACSKCDIETVEFLIKLGANPRDTALIPICIHTNRVEILRLLIQNGLDVRYVELNDLRTCLDKHYYSMIELLLEHYCSSSSNILDEISEEFIQDIRETDNDICQRIFRKYFSQMFQNEMLCSSQLL